MKEDGYTITGIENVVCDELDISVDDMHNKTNSYDPAVAKGFVIFILREKYGVSIKDIQSLYNLTRRTINWHIQRSRFLITQKKYEKIKNLIIG